MDSNADNNKCWCGSNIFKPFNSAYHLCSSCGTLIVQYMPSRSEVEAGSDDEGFYGKRYWRDFVPNTLKLPTLDERARSDLSERCIYWLDRIIEYLPPGSSILELGCGNGAFVYLTEKAGYEAQGLELSPWVIEFIRKTFGVGVYQGPLEVAQINRQFSAIAAFDVLEHLLNPVETLCKCADILNDDGLLFLQTPCYRGEGHDWKMLNKEEHLFIFNEDSVHQLLLKAGFRDIHITESLFPYDMLIVASKDRLRKRSNPLEGLEPLPRALLSLDGEMKKIRNELRAVRARLNDIQSNPIRRLTKRLRKVFKKGRRA